MRSTGTTARLAAIAIALAVSGCGGGNDGGTTTGSRIASFTAADPTPPAQSVSLQAGSRTGDVVNVLVSATGVTDAFGAAFHLTYDPAAVRYEAFDSAASFLRDPPFDTAGAALDFRVDTSLGGRLLVLATRRQNGTGTAPGVNVPGTRTLLSLRFKALVNHAGTPLGLADPKEVRDSQDAPLAVTWWGGSISAN